MGQSIVDQVISLLNAGGVMAEWAQPQGKMAILHSVVAAVSYQKIEQSDRTATVRVEIVGSVDSGGRRCEELAVKAYEILRNAGAVCSMGRCSFVGRLGQFSIPLLAVFKGDVYDRDWVPLEEETVGQLEVTIDGVVLPHTIQFAATQAVGNADTDELSEMAWRFTIEEWIPAGEMAPENPTGLFEMMVTTAGSKESFEGCCMTEIKRETDAKGVRQIRQGISTVRSIQAVT